VRPGKGAATGVDVLLAKERHRGLGVVVLDLLRRIVQHMQLADRDPRAIP
jgi:hypothetical protein